jgi:hypothetical protein
MRYLLFSLSLWLGACTSAYKGLTPVAADAACAARLAPNGLGTSWYTTAVDVYGKHISGLLLMKQMPDSSTRVVFTNEAGVTFFDFSFAADGSFQARQVISKLNKKPVIETFRKDFALILGLPFRNGVWQAWREGDAVYYGVAQKKETAYFITGPDCASLRRLELGSRRKRKVTIERIGNDALLPDSILIQHHTFPMTISLRKLERP